MTSRVLVASTLLAAAGAARAEGFSVGLEATVGGQHLGLTRTPVAQEPLLPMGDLGGALLLRAGGVELGAATEGNFDKGTLQRYDASLLGGLAIDVLAVLRVEALGELGAANLRDAASNGGGWNRFYGVRPGLSLGLPVLPLRVGVWGLARWGLPGTGGGPAYGMLGRVGIEF